MVYVEDPAKRLVLFKRRLIGLFKKASELCILCDARVSLSVQGIANENLIYTYNDGGGGHGHEVHQPASASSSATTGLKVKEYKPKDEKFIDINTQSYAQNMQQLSSPTSSSSSMPPLSQAPERLCMQQLISSYEQPLTNLSISGCGQPLKNLTISGHMQPLTNLPISGDEQPSTSLSISGQGKPLTNPLISGYEQPLTKLPIACYEQPSTNLPIEDDTFDAIDLPDIDCLLDDMRGITKDDDFLSDLFPLVPDPELHMNDALQEISGHGQPLTNPPISGYEQPLTNLPISDYERPSTNLPMEAYTFDDIDRLLKDMPAGVMDDYFQSDLLPLVPDRELHMNHALQEIHPQQQQQQQPEIPLEQQDDQMDLDLDHMEIESF